MRPTLLALGVLFCARTIGALQPDVIQAVAAVPSHLAGRFVEPRGFQQSASGQFFVFDRRTHTVFGIDEEFASSWPIVQVGAEPGRVIEPTALSVASDGTFAVADTPRGRARIQTFSPVGFPIRAFIVPGLVRPRITFEGVIMDGAGSVHYTGSTILMSQPENGSLITEYALAGAESRAFGRLRPTGHENDRDVHLALNSGIPLVNPRGGFYFVFQAGLPVFQAFDASGRLLFERRIQGRELDGAVSALPTTWPRRGGELPLVPPTVRAAAVDRHGNLWVSFVVPYTYVFDPDGDKIRTVQFRGAGLIAPGGLSFGPKGTLLVSPGLYVFDVESTAPGDGGATPTNMGL